MAAQLELAVDNLEAVLADADMSLGEAGGFATNPLGVSRLAAPDLLVLLEATAVA